MKTCSLVLSLLVYKQPLFTHRLNFYFSRMFVFYMLRSKQLTYCLPQFYTYTCVLRLQQDLLDYAVLSFPENFIRENIYNLKYF